MAKGGRISVKPFMGARTVRASRGATVAALQANFRAQVGGIVGALEEFISEINNIVPDVLVEALEPTLGKALEYCPSDTGALRDSAYLEAEKRYGKHVVAIGFGKGGQPDYAIYVHELPYAHEAPTRSKFLQTALDEDYYQIIGSIPRLIKEKAGT